MISAFNTYAEQCNQWARERSRQEAFARQVFETTSVALRPCEYELEGEEAGKKPETARVSKRLVVASAEDGDEREKDGGDKPETEGDDGDKPEAVRVSKRPSAGMVSKRPAAARAVDGGEHETDDGNEHDSDADDSDVHEAVTVCQRPAAAKRLRKSPAASTTFEPELVPMTNLVIPSEEIDAMLDKLSGAKLTGGEAQLTAGVKSSLQGWCEEDPGSEIFEGWCEQSRVSELFEVMCEEGSSSELFERWSEEERASEFLAQGDVEESLGGRSFFVGVGEAKFGASRRGRWRR